MTLTILYAAMAGSAAAAVPAVDTPEPGTFVMVGGVGVAALWIRHKRGQKK